MKLKINFAIPKSLKYSIILILCAGIYFANSVTIGSGDTVPNSLIAFNFLENHTVNLDIFRKSYFCVSTCAFFVEGNNGHLSSIYPIGTAIVSFPLYLIFYAYLKLILYASSPIDLTVVKFDVYRLFFEKLAALIITVITVAIFYLASRLKFNKSISILSTFIFAFATNTWMISSQALWQHGSSNLALISTIFFLLKSNYSSHKSQKIWLLLAGIACGLLPGIRPTSTLYAVAAIVYVIFTYRLQSIFFFAGLVSGLPSILWNLYFFGNLTGGYAKMFPELPYVFTFNSFFTSSLGTLISPSRGLIVYSPILLYSLPGAKQMLKFRTTKDENLLGCMTISSALIILSYCFYRIWWGGCCYGPRFMTDILPVACYLINYFLEREWINLFNWQRELKLKSLIILRLLFPIFLIFSIFVQIVGAFGFSPGVYWNVYPLDAGVPKYQYRLWELKDTQIERNSQALFHLIFKPPIDNPDYIKGLQGIIKGITDEQNQLLTSSISVQPNAEKLLKVKLENTGLSTWFGYESALRKGEIRVRGHFYDINNHPVSEVIFFVSGMHKQHDLTYAIADVIFPQEKGVYKLGLEIVAEGISHAFLDNQPYVVKINVGGKI